LIIQEDINICNVSNEELLQNKEYGLVIVILAIPNLKHFKVNWLILLSDPKDHTRMAKAKCEVCNAEFWLYPKKNK